MKKKLTAGAIIFVAGFIAAFALMAYYNSWSDSKNQGVELPKSDLRPTTEVPAGGPVPSVSVEAFVDGADGYNLYLVTENFTFSPGLVGESSTPNTGYASIYINGQKQSRVYGSWHHVSLGQLAKGQNTIEVVLTANDHTEWTKDGEFLLDSVILENFH